jgi:hypothetical protein
LVANAEMACWSNWQECCFPVNGSAVEDNVRL